MRAFVLALLFLVAAPLQAERIKDLASVQGVRANQLVGYGLVVGLDGSGDQTTQAPFTAQSVLSMLSQLGVNLPPGANGLQLKNVAAVMVTAELPPFARPGQTIDVTVSSLGNAKSLRGGTLLLTPLKGVDGQVYAIAQGNILVGGAGESANGSKMQVNHLSAGRIAGGATVERMVPAPLGDAETVAYQLHTADFTTAHRIAEAINANLGFDAAAARDGRHVAVRAPRDPSERVAFLARIESIEVEPGRARARVIVNARTGSVVMNQAVMIEPCAVAHGNLSVVVATEPLVSQPAPFGRGETVVAQQSQVEIRADRGGLTLVEGASLADVVKALNAIGATPMDLLAILQAMKAAGALRAELEII